MPWVQKVRSIITKIGVKHIGIKLRLIWSIIGGWITDKEVEDCDRDAKEKEKEKNIGTKWKNYLCSFL